MPRFWLGLTSSPLHTGRHNPEHPLSPKRSTPLAPLRFLRGQHGETDRDRGLSASCPSTLLTIKDRDTPKDTPTRTALHIAVTWLVEAGLVTGESGEASSPLRALAARYMTAQSRPGPQARAAIHVRGPPRENSAMAPRLRYVDSTRPRCWFSRAYAAFSATQPGRFLSEKLAWKVDPYLLRATRGRLAHLRHVATLA